MSAKIDYTRGELTSLKSQVAAQQTALGNLSSSIAQAEGLLNAREAFGEEPNRDTIEAKFVALSAAADSINSLSLSVPAQADFMDGYDTAVDPE